MKVPTGLLLLKTWSLSYNTKMSAVFSAEPVWLTCSDGITPILENRG